MYLWDLCEPFISVCGRLEWENTSSPFSEILDMYCSTSVNKLCECGKS